MQRNPWRKKRRKTLGSEPVARLVWDVDGRPLGLWFFGAAEPIYLFGDPQESPPMDA